jgi:hypothetical protein
MKITKNNKSQVPPVVAPGIVAKDNTEAIETKSNETAPKTKFESVSQSTKLQEIEVIKAFNGLPVCHKATVSKNVAEVLILKKLVK